MSYATKELPGWMEIIQIVIRYSVKADSLIFVHFSICKLYLKKMPVK